MNTDKQRNAIIALARAAFQLGGSAPGTQPERRSAQGVVKAAYELSIGPDELLVLFYAEKILGRKDNERAASDPSRTGVG